MAAYSGVMTMPYSNRHPARQIGEFVQSHDEAHRPRGGLTLKILILPVMSQQRLKGFRPRPEHGVCANNTLIRADIRMNFQHCATCTVRS